MRFLHEELRQAREKARLSQQALAELAGVPRNQIVRAEQGQNITIDTLRRIAVHLPVTDLTLIDTKGLRVDVIAHPEKLFLGAMNNVMLLTEALCGALQLAIDAGAAAEAALRAGGLSSEGEESPEGYDALPTLRRMQRFLSELPLVSKEPDVEP